MMSDDDAKGFVSRNDQLNLKSNRKSKRGKGGKKDGTVKKGKSKRKNKKMQERKGRGNLQPRCLRAGSG